MLYTELNLVAFRGNLGILWSYICCMNNRFNWTDKQQGLMEGVEF